MERDRYLDLSVERLLRQEFGPQPWLKKASEIAVHEVIDALRYNPAWLAGLGIGRDRRISVSPRSWTSSMERSMSAVEEMVNTLADRELKIGWAWRPDPQHWSLRVESTLDADHDTYESFTKPTFEECLNAAVGWSEFLVPILGPANAT